MLSANLKFGPMLIENFGSFSGKHVFNWDRGPSLWYIAGSNKVEPELGANGAGKTTLLVALFWCLFGRTLRNVRPGERIEPWHYTGTTSVRLGLINNGQKHDLYRSRKPNKLLLDDRVVTDEELRSLLPDPDVMLYSFLLGQTNTLFLDLKPEPQSQLFTNLLELDTWLVAAERAGKAATDAGREVEKADLEISTLNGRIVELNEGLSAAQNKEREYESETNQKLFEFDAAITALKKQVAETGKALKKLPEYANNLTHPALEAELADAAKNLRAWRDVKVSADAKLSVERASLRKSDSSAATASKGSCPTCGQSLGKKDHERLHVQFIDQSAETAKTIEILVARHREAVEQELEWGSIHRETETKLNALREKDRAQQSTRRDLERQATRLAAELTAKQTERQKLYESENPHTSMLSLIHKRLSGFEEDLKNMTTEKAEVERLRDTAKLWQDGFRTIRLSIIEDTLTEVALAANRHAERLGLSGWQIEFATERETKKGTTSLGFTTLLYPPDVDRPIPWDSYSGGESQRLQLSSSFGLGEVLLARAGIAPNIEVYDEPTRGLSPDGISDLLECLADRARETGRTIWLIDHHSIDRGAFDGTVLVEKTDEGSRLIQ